MERKSVRTTDGVRLSYLEGGEGRPLILLPGWSQGATIFGRQFVDFCQIGRVIALDHRGHGDSDKPDHGYEVERLAKDLFEVIDSLHLQDADIVAHSMGVAVAWCYLLLFGAEKQPRRLVLVDEPRALLARPDWSEQEREQAGAIIPSLQSLAEFLAKVRASESPKSIAAILRPMFTAAIGESDLRDIARENLKLPRRHAATLLADNVIQDWRPVIESIRLPALVFAGAASVHPPASQRWIADAIPGAAEFELFSRAEGGSHFLSMRIRRASTRG